MDALVMCGGRGTRLDAGVEKPLFEVGGRPMIDRVRAALAGSRVGQVYPVVSPNAPDTREYLATEYDLIDTPGDGYVDDLRVALEDERVTRPVLTVAADLPLLAAAHVDRALGRYDGRSLTVCVPVPLVKALGLSVGTTRAHDGGDLSPTGLNVVAAEDDDHVVRGDNRNVVSEYNRNVVSEYNTKVVREDNSVCGREITGSGSGATDTPDTVHRGSDEDILISYDVRLAVNVNRRSDAAVAEVLAGGP